MSSAILHYKNLTALNRAEHKSLKLKPSEEFGFIDKAHCLPLAGVEFYQASRYYPIVFISEGEGKNAGVAPLALVGLEAGCNAFVGKNRKWKADTYIPAIVRRYPFTPATVEGTKNPEEFTLCFDAACPGFNTTEGSSLFNDDGTDSDYLKNTVQFLVSVTKDMQRTQTFVKELKELGLLERRSADIRNAAGATFQVQDFLVVSEEKFAKLTGAQLKKLQQEDFLGWIFAHLMSLANLPLLLDMHLARKADKK